jgi:hypothetical protein
LVLFLDEDEPRPAARSSFLAFEPLLDDRDPYVDVEVPGEVAA